jgi:hypothetical protein
MGLDAIGWAYSQLSRGVNETRGKQRIVNTIMPAVELPEERKKRGSCQGWQCLVPPSHLLVGVITHPRVGNMLYPVRGCVIVINRRHTLLGKHEIAERTVERM